MLAAACAGPPAPPPAATPIPERAATAEPTPRPTWAPGQRRALGDKLAAIFANDIFNQGGGLVVLDAAGDPLFGAHETRAMTPASTLKLVVGAAALRALGPAYRFATAFAAPVPVDSDGTLASPLWLVGSGDPLLTSNDVRGGVGMLVRGGLRRVDGALNLDDRALAGPEQNPRWDPDDLDQGYAAAISALSLDQGTVEFDVKPGEPGAPALVTIEPPNADIDLYGSVQTVGPGSDSTVYIDRRPDPPGARPPEVNTFDVSGTIVTGETQKFWKPVLGFPSYVGGAVTGMLQARGISVLPDPTLAPVPPGAQTLWLHHSPPLSAILTDMLVTSNNHTAEQLLRVLGETGGRPGTTEGGIAAERRALALLHVPAPGLRLYDGSGLSPDDRIAPLTLAELLQRVIAGPDGATFLRALPRVGMDGTVVYHELHVALGVTRAKSGHIEGVNALAGTTMTAHHGRVYFAFIVNDPRCNADAVTQGQDAALDALAEF